MFELLERGHIHLTTVALISKYLTEENHRELLQEVRGKSKRQVLKILVRRWPKSEAASELRRLPQPLHALRAGPTGTLEPLTESSRRLQLQMSERLKEKLELARDLMSHANPSGDLADPRQVAVRDHIPHETLRQLVARDGLGCSYMTEDGTRCGCRAFLQVHHEQPWAKGGADEVDNLQLLCAFHNRLLAEQEFGASHVRGAIEHKQKPLTNQRAQLPPRAKAS